MDRVAVARCLIISAILLILRPTTGVSSTSIHWVPAEP